MGVHTIIARIPCGWPAGHGTRGTGHGTRNTGHGTPARLEELSQREHLLAHSRLPPHRRGVRRECGRAPVGRVGLVERLAEDVLRRDGAHVGVAEAGLERGALRLGEQRRVRLPVRLTHEAAQVARHTRGAATGLQRSAQQLVAVQVLQHQDAPCLRRRRRRS